MTSETKMVPKNKVKFKLSSKGNGQSFGDCALSTQGRWRGEAWLDPSPVTHSEPSPWHFRPSVTASDRWPLPSPQETEHCFSPFFFFLIKVSTGFDHTEIFISTAAFLPSDFIVMEWGLEKGM